MCVSVYVGMWVCAQEGGCLGREAEVIRFHEGGVAGSRKWTTEDAGNWTVHTLNCGSISPVPSSSSCSCWLNILEEGNLIYREPYLKSTQRCLHCWRHLEVWVGSAYSRKVQSKGLKASEPGQLTQSSFQNTVRPLLLPSQQLLTCLTSV